MLLSFYRRGAVCHLVATFYLCGAIQTNNANLINQIMVVSMLKNWSCRYSSHYFIKICRLYADLLCYELGYCLSYMVFSYLYLGSINILQV